MCNPRPLPGCLAGPASDSGLPSPKRQKEPESAGSSVGADGACLPTCLPGLLYDPDGHTTCLRPALTAQTLPRGPALCPSFSPFPQGSKGSGGGGAKFLSEATATPAGKKGLGGPGGCRLKSSNSPLGVLAEAQKNQARWCEVQPCGSGGSNLRRAWSHFTTGWASESRDDLGKIPQLHLFCSVVY